MLDTLVEYTFELTLLPGVVGVGSGECSGSPCIQIVAMRESEEPTERLPRTLDEYTLEVQVVGDIGALDPR